MKKTPLIYFSTVMLCCSSMHLNHSCSCYSCSSNFCIEEETNGIAFKIWFIDLANSNTNVAQVYADQQLSLRVYGSVKARSCSNPKCSSQLYIESEFFQEQICGSGNWDFDRTMTLNAPTEPGQYDISISQGFDLFCSENSNQNIPENSNIILGTVFVNSKSSQTQKTYYKYDDDNYVDINDDIKDNDEIVLSTSDDFRSCDIHCPSMCHVVPHQYLPDNKNVERMTYRNIAIGTAVGAGITFALSSHFLKTAVTFSTPWKPPPPSLANTWIGSAAVTVGASLLAQYWLTTTCSDHLLFNLGLGFSSVGVLSCLIMFGFRIKMKCFDQNNTLSTNRTSSHEVDSRRDDLLRNEYLPHGHEDSTHQHVDDEVSNGMSASRHRTRGAWIVHVGSAYVRIVSGLETLPGVSEDAGLTRGSSEDITTPSAEMDEECSVVPVFSSGAHEETTNDIPVASAVAIFA